MPLAYDVEGLPEQAGVATLWWFKKIPEETRFPMHRRDTGEILLPYRPDNRFFVLEEGRKLILKTDMGMGSICFFLGQDERRTFLNQIQPRAFEAYLRGGERAFFNALKPATVRRVEKIFGGKARRQGDIWAAKVADDWPEIWSGGKFLAEEFCKIPVGNRHIFGTRHCLAGPLALARGSFGGKKSADYLFASGRLTAPDHAPLVLEGVHLLGRTRNLVAPLPSD